MATPLPPPSYRELVAQLIRMGWRAERNLNLDIWVLTGPTGQVLKLDRKTLEETSSLEEAMRVALAKAELDKPKQPRFWDGRRELDVEGT